MKQLGLVLSMAATIAFAAVSCSDDAASTADTGSTSGADAGVTKPDMGACDKGNKARPAGRAEMAGVFDPKRRRLYFFGGDNGVPVQCNPRPNPVGGMWMYDAVCATWKELKLPKLPPIRARAMAIYDSARDQMVIFGGRYRKASSGRYTLYNDVWAFDLEKMTWKELTTTGAKPVARNMPRGGYSSGTNEMIVFGGSSSTSGLSYTPHNDVWALNLETLAWREIKATGAAPAKRLFHSAAVDPAGKKLYIYGGGDHRAFVGPFFGDLWEFDLAKGTWKELDKGTSTGIPNTRIWSTLTWDRFNKRVLLFGGHDLGVGGLVGNNNDTWAFDPATKKWTALTKGEKVNKPAISFCNFPADFTIPDLKAPERRAGHLAALDDTRGEWIIFGGKTDCGIVDDVWTFDLSRNAWIEQLKATKGEACNRGANPKLCVAMCKAK